MSDLYAVIGGSGLYALDQRFRVEYSQALRTPYGEISSEILIGELNQRRLVFFPRHGSTHRIPPHKINYRANIWALRELGVSHVIAVNAVGGIDVAPLGIVIPDQIIDYTSGRPHTFFDGDQSEFDHIDFSMPYSEDMRDKIISASLAQRMEVRSSATYGCTNGPRFETGAEILKMQKDGCNIIGMTGMPEAALARELNMEYASIALVVNWCAGIETSTIKMDKIRMTLEQGMTSVFRLIEATLGQTK